MVGFNLTVEDRAKLVAEYEAKAGEVVKPVKHDAQPEGAESNKKAHSAKAKAE